MGWFILKHIFSTLLAIVNVRRLSDQEKDLEILVLRQQLSILQRKLNHPIKPSKIEKLTLAILTNRLKRTTHQTANNSGMSSASSSLKPYCAGKASPALSEIGNWLRALCHRFLTRQADASVRSRMMRGSVFSR